jgi:Zn-dependent protease with chaperone function
MTLLAFFGAWWTATLLPWAIDATFVGLLLLALARAGKRVAPGVRIGISTIGLAKLALPPVLLPVGLLSFGVMDASGVATPLGSPLAGSWLGALGLMHAGGVALAAALLGRQLWQLRELRKEARSIPDPALERMVKTLAKELGLRRAARVVESDRADVPFVTGLLRPLIVLPKQLIGESTPRQLSGLLAHELVHLRCGDLWLGWLRRVAVTLWWPLPVARALARVQEIAVEERCDDLVLARGLASRPDYARGLLVAATHACDRRSSLPIAAAVSRGELEQRILRLASRASYRSSRLAISGLVLLVLLVLPASSTGTTSSAGWTTRVLFAHPLGGGPSGAHETPHDHSHGR